VADVFGRVGDLYPQPVAASCARLCSDSRRNSSTDRAMTFTPCGSFRYLIANSHGVEMFLSRLGAAGGAHAIDHLGQFGPSNRLFTRTVRADRAGGCVLWLGRGSLVRRRGTFMMIAVAAA
jgi:hypothetical protein